MTKIKQEIDPRTTRRVIDYQKWVRNSALYSQYQAINFGISVNGSPSSVTLQKKPEFCQRKEL